MNVLSCQISSENGLSFELVVDDQLLGERIGDGNEGIPYWIVEDELPYWPPYVAPREPDVRIVSVCSCGEYGCGQTRCRVEKKEDRVILRDFEGDVGEKGKLFVFEFSRRNYDEVVSKVVSETNKRKQAEAKNKDVQ